MLADYEAKLASVYATPQDTWLPLDLSGQWPAGRGMAQATLAALAEQTHALVTQALGT